MYLLVYEASVDQIYRPSIQRRFLIALDERFLSGAGFPIIPAPEWAGTQDVFCFPGNLHLKNEKDGSMTCVIQ
jgi:hypothetical protein